MHHVVRVPIEIGDGERRLESAPGLQYAVVVEPRGEVVAEFGRGAEHVDARGTRGPRVDDGRRRVVDLGGERQRRQYAPDHVGRAGAGALERVFEFGVDNRHAVAERARERRPDILGVVVIGGVVLPDGVGEQVVPERVLDAVEDHVRLDAGGDGVELRRGGLVELQ